MGRFLSEGAKRNLKVLRVTKESHNLTTVPGRESVRSDVLGLAKEGKVHLWASLPCRPWSQLAELNRRKLGPGFRARSEILREESLVLVGVFIDLAKIVQTNGGSVSFEWPAH